MSVRAFSVAFGAFLCLSVLGLFPAGLCPAHAEEVGEIVGYEGDDFGAPIPQWVLDVHSGDSKRLKKDMGLAAEKKVWILPIKGDSLDFISAWADEVDVVSLVMRDVQRAALAALAAEPKLSAAEKERRTALVSEELDYLTVNGLEKTTAFWLCEYAGEKADGPSYIYTYYAVFTMRKDIWSRQVRALLGNIEALPPKSAKAALGALTGIAVIDAGEA